MVLNRQVAEVICAASVQHLHLRLETLPVGLIVVDKNAAIVSADAFSEQLLGFSGKEKGRSITSIFGEVANNWIRALGKRENSYLGCLHLITSAGIRLKMEIAAAPSIAPHLNDLHIVFAFDS